MPKAAVSIADLHTRSAAGLAVYKSLQLGIALPSHPPSLDRSGSASSVHQGSLFIAPLHPARSTTSVAPIDASATATCSTLSTSLLRLLCCAALFSVPYCAALCCAVPCRALTFLHRNQSLTLTSSPKSPLSPPSDAAQESCHRRRGVQVCKEKEMVQGQGQGQGKHFPALPPINYPSLFEPLLTPFFSLLRDDDVGDDRPRTWWFLTDLRTTAS